MWIFLLKKIQKRETTLALYSFFWRVLLMVIPSECQDLQQQLKK